MASSSSFQLLLLSVLVFCAVIGLSQAASSKPAPIGNWKQLKAQGTIPIERPYAACALHDKNLFVYGGRTGVTSWSQSVHRFDLETSRWTPTKLQAADQRSILPKLAGHTFTKISEDEYLVFGGRTGIFSYSNDIYLVNLQEETSQYLTPTSALKPAARWEHASAFFNGNLFVFGGATKDSFNDIFAYNVSEKKWNTVTPRGVTLPHIHGHSATVAHGKIYIIGGYLKDDRFNTDVFVYDVESNTMKKISHSGLKPRAFHTSSLIGNYIFVVGGVKSDSQLVEEVQIFHTLKDHTIDYPLAGKFPTRKNHCSAVDEKNRSVVVFGGISAKRWGSSASRNDVVILDTSSNTRNASNAPLTQRLTAVILDINSEILNKQNYTEGSPIEQQLLSQIENEPKEEFANLPQRISDCKEIERLYHEVVNSEANRRDIVSQSRMYIDEIKKISDGYSNLKNQLAQDAVSSEDMLKNLTSLEHQLEESRQLHAQAKQDEIRAREQKQSARKQLSTVESSIKKAESQITSAKAKRNSLKESLVIYNNMLKNSDADFAAKQKEEKDVLDKLRILQRNLGNATTDAESLRKKILELENSIRDTESHLQTLLNLPIQQMRQLYETGDQALKQLMAMFSLVLKVVDKNDVQSPGNADLDQFNPDRIAHKIEVQIQQVREKLRRERELLERLKAELAALNQNVSSVEVEISKWKRKHEEIEKAINQINSLKTDSDKKRAELEADVKSADDNVASYRAEVSTLRKNLGEVEKRIKQYGKDELQHAHKKEEEAAREANLQKKVRKLRGELEDIDAELQRKFHEAQEIQRDLKEMRTSLSMSKELFDTQTSGVNDAREKLLRKLRESEQRCATCEEERAALRKEVKSLKRRVAELEAQLKKK